MISLTYLEGQEEQECLNRVVSSVYEVPHEEVVGIGTLSTDLEELHQVMKLSVDITAYLCLRRIVRDRELFEMMRPSMICSSLQ